MMRLTRPALLLGFALFAGARAAAAQTIPSPFRHIDQTQSPGVFAGYLLTSTGIAITDSTSAPMGPRSGPLLGVRYQVRASGPLSIEGSVGVTPTDRRLFAPGFVDDSARVEARDLETTVPATVLMGDLGLRFHLTGPRTWNGLAPFVAGMGGVVHDVQGSSSAEEEIESSARFRFGPSFAVGAGLGTDWFPARNASIRVEAQGRLWRMRTPAGFLVGNDERRQWNEVFGLSVGGALHF